MSEQIQNDIIDKVIQNLLSDDRHRSKLLKFKEQYGDDKYVQIALEKDIELKREFDLLHFCLPDLVPNAENINNNLIKQILNIDIKDPKIRKLQHYNIVKASLSAGKLIIFIIDKYSTELININTNNDGTIPMVKMQEEAFDNVWNRYYKTIEVSLNKKLIIPPSYFNIIIQFMIEFSFEKKDEDNSSTPGLNIQKKLVKFFKNITPEMKIHLDQNLKIPDSSTSLPDNIKEQFKQAGKTIDDKNESIIIHHMSNKVTAGINQVKKVFSEENWYTSM